MADQKIRVRLIYRNYKPLHNIYQSLIDTPPKNVEYIIPAPKQYLKKYFRLYKLLNSIPVARKLVYLSEKLLFLQTTTESTTDIYHYVNMIDSLIPKKPYVVDIEHATGLISFSTDKNRINKVIDFLNHPNCKAINCLSQAAKRTLVDLLGEDYRDIKHKVNLIYPSLPFINKSDYPVTKNYFTNKPDTLKMVFVGNLAYLKGIEELLLAVKDIEEMYPGKTELQVISDDAKPAVEKFALKNVKLLPPKFSHHEIISDFYLPADLFILPTKSETFGMAILDALASGTPVISTKQFAITELIDDKKDGFLIEKHSPILDSKLMPTKDDFDSVIKPNLDIEYAEKLKNLILKIINEKTNLIKMGQLGKSKFKKGSKFSSDTRNKKLMQIYISALDKN